MPARVTEVAHLFVRSTACGSLPALFHGVLAAVSVMFLVSTSRSRSTSPGFNNNCSDKLKKQQIVIYYLFIYLYITKLLESVFTIS